MNEQEVNVEQQDDYAGALRSVLRFGVTRIAAVASIGAFPRTKIVSSIKFVDLIHDAVSMKNIASKHFDNVQTNFSRRSITGNPVYAKYRHVIAHSSYEFLKNSILGTVLFEIYERSISTISSSENGLLYYFGAGLLGGISHGAITVGFEYLEQLPLRVKLYTRSRKIKNFSVSRSTMGTLFSHSLSHSCLFGVYEALKWAIMKDVDPNTEYREEYFWSTVFMSGILSGVISEYIAHYVSLFETRFIVHHHNMPHLNFTHKGRGIFKNITNAGKLLWYHPKPSIGQILLASVPSAIGFLAYEIGNV